MLENEEMNIREIFLKMRKKSTFFYNFEDPFIFKEMEDNHQLLQPKFLALKNRLNGMVPEGKMTDSGVCFLYKIRLRPPHFLSLKCR